MRVYLNQNKWSGQLYASSENLALATVIVDDAVLRTECKEVYSLITSWDSDNDNEALENLVNYFKKDKIDSYKKLEQILIEYEATPTNYQKILKNIKEINIIDRHNYIKNYINICLYEEEYITGSVRDRLIKTLEIYCEEELNFISSLEHSEIEFNKIKLYSLQ